MPKKGAKTSCWKSCII